MENQVYPHPKDMPQDWLDFDHQYRVCKVKGCGRRGRWEPILCISMDGVRYAKLPMKRIFCDHCKGSIGLEVGGELLTQETWSLIRMQFIKKGIEPPIREFTYLEWREA